MIQSQCHSRLGPKYSLNDVCVQQYMKELKYDDIYIGLSSSITNTLDSDAQRRVDCLKQKPDNQQSANASKEVKMRLQKFVLRKQNCHDSSSNQLYNRPENNMDVDNSSLYENLQKSLRKTASEPNIRFHIPDHINYNTCHQRDFVGAIKNKRSISKRINPHSTPVYDYSLMRKKKMTQEGVNIDHALYQSPSLPNLANMCHIPVESLLSHQPRDSIANTASSPQFRYDFGPGVNPLLDQSLAFARLPPHQCVPGGCGSVYHLMDEHHSSFLFGRPTKYLHVFDAQTSPPSYESTENEFLQSEKFFKLNHLRNRNYGDGLNIGIDETKGVNLTQALTDPSETICRLQQTIEQGNHLVYDSKLDDSKNLNRQMNLDPHIQTSRTTAVVYDSLMLKHQCAVCTQHSPTLSARAPSAQSQHPEHPARLQAIWSRLQLERFSDGRPLLQNCKRLPARKASWCELVECHSQTHIDTVCGTVQDVVASRTGGTHTDTHVASSEMLRLPCGGLAFDSDTVWNRTHTGDAARMAVGCVIDLSLAVARNKFTNGFALVRPPGHHAEHSLAMGFCYFNSVAIATRILHSRLSLQRILIVDWDIHHGNGIQQAFYADRRALYISLHRYDNSQFFPGSGDILEKGYGDGVGYNVNIAWSGSHAQMSDAEYMAAFRSVVMPIARCYNPEIILVSCGFDAARNHSDRIGGYNLSPACFAWMTKQLLTMANGKVILALEGGYDPDTISECAVQCLRALEGAPTQAIAIEELTRSPIASATCVLDRVIQTHVNYWPILANSACLVSISHAHESFMQHQQTAETLEQHAPSTPLPTCSVPRHQSHTMAPHQALNQTQKQRQTCSGSSDAGALFALADLSLNSHRYRRQSVLQSGCQMPSK